MAFRLQQQRRVTANHAGPAGHQNLHKMPPSKESALFYAKCCQSLLGTFIYDRQNGNQAP
jgi:hypothetical protein